MRVLVVGGTEFVSLHVVRALQREGHEVAILNRGRRPERVPAGVRAITVDRTQHAALARAVAGLGFDAVYDIAYAPTTAADVAAMLDALGVGVRHAIFVSSGRVYDHAQPIPFSEETPRSLYWGEYAKFKIEGEDVLLDRHRRTGLPVTIVRPTHVYGPLNTRHNETFFFDRIGRGRPVLVPGAGGWLRQFGHVEDLADTLAAMLGNPRAAGQTYNTTGEEVITQVGLVELIAEVVGRPVTVVPFDPALLTRVPAGRVFGQNLVYDCHAVYTTTKLRGELGLRPRHTLGAGLAQTWEWYRKEGLDHRPVDFATEDALLALIRS